VSVKLQDTLEALYGLERRKDKLGLEGTRALLGALGHAERRFHSVHVAGTNGKGTVCALIERVLRAAGIRTGLFTSPHLIDFRERIRIAGRWADGAFLEARLAHIQSLPEGRDRTFFEVCTALGVRHVRRARRRMGGGRGGPGRPARLHQRARARGVRDHRASGSITPRSSGAPSSRSRRRRPAS
jgi:dihydrofolate synthase/folylpolyglutamate synthase